MMSLSVGLSYVAMFIIAQNLHMDSDIAVHPSYLTYDILTFYSRPGTKCDIDHPRLRLRRLLSPKATTKLNPNLKKFQFILARLPLGKT